MKLKRQSISFYAALVMSVLFTICFSMTALPAITKEEALRKYSEWLEENDWDYLFEYDDPILFGVDYLNNDDIPDLIYWSRGYDGYNTSHTYFLAFINGEMTSRRTTYYHGYRDCYVFRKKGILMAFQDEENRIFYRYSPSTSSDLSYKVERILSHENDGAGEYYDDVYERYLDQDRFNSMLEEFTGGAAPHKVQLYANTQANRNKVLEYRISLANASISLVSGRPVYNGKEKKPDLTVTVNGVKKKKGTDYTVTYSNNINAGTAKAQITGIGNYSGTATKAFTIEKAGISNVDVSISSTGYTYNGEEKKPSVTVSLNGVSLKAGSDYSKSYSNNINAGTAKVIISGTGNYTGSVTKTFTIYKAKTTIAASSVKKKVGNKNFKLSYTANRSGIRFSCSDTSIAYVSGTGWVKVKKPGRVIITLSGAETGNYRAGRKRIYLTVLPSDMEFSDAASRTSRTVSLSWPKNTSGSLYQIYCAKDNRFTTGKRSIRISDMNKTSVVISRLESGSYYYFKIRSAAKVNGKWYAGAWSKVRRVKVR